MNTRYVANLLLVATLGYQTPRLKSVMPILDPRTSTTGNTVVATANVDANGAIKAINVLQGVDPFTQRATEAISQWQFEPARFSGHAIDSEISVIFMFRPPAFSHFGVGGPSLGFVRPDIPKGNHPALPVMIFDPEWPVARLLNPGVVIFDLEINDDGFIHRMRLINDAPAMAGLARQTVRRWNLTPAIKDGRAVRSTMIVAISFAAPLHQ